MTPTPRFDRDGYEVLRQPLAPEEVEAWRAAVGGFGSAVARNLLADCDVWRLAHSTSLRSVCKPILGDEPIAVRALLFDKTRDENWGVGWHQDTVIAVAEETPHAPLGYTAWSIKGGVPHVRPPVEVLERMVILRLALDDADEENGALRVIAESHRSGRLEPVEVKERVASTTAVTCATAAGDVVAMRPLLLHASTKSIAGRRRRVVHVEYAAEPLPQPLSWPRWRHGQDPAVDGEPPS